jgi:RNA polymerase sigma-70 factor (ECF subfamily)
MNRQEPDDAELVAKALVGNGEAFGILYDRYAAVVRAVVLAVSRDWAAVDDMVQECFLRAYGKLTSLRDPAMFGQWVAGIARHVARERRRSLGRDRHETIGQHAVEIEWHAAAHADGHTREQLAEVIRQLAELPERERLAIHAFYLEGRDARQVSAILGLSRSGFYSLVQRAVARLAARIRSNDVETERK